MLSEKRNKDGQKRSLALELLPWAMESQPVKAVKAGLLIGGVDPVAVWAAPGLYATDLMQSPFTVRVGGYQVRKGIDPYGVIPRSTSSSRATS